MGLVVVSIILMGERIFLMEEVPVGVVEGVCRVTRILKQGQYSDNRNETTPRIGIRETDNEGEK